MVKVFTTVAALAFLTGCGLNQNSGAELNKDTNQSQSIMDQEKALAIIESTEDKASIEKSVWLASGMTKLEYDVIWNAGTERPGTSPLNNEKRKGTFVTKACGLPVFSSEHKYDSKTGWPSFWEANKDNIILKEDNKFGWKRTEVLSKCGEHLGHVFTDGPEPTGLRYCMNGAALEFIPDEEV